MAFFGRFVLLSLFLIGSIPSFSQVCDCVTTGNCPVPVNDNGTYNGVLDVTVNGENDLGENPLSSVCFTITHTWIGDLSVSLTSPSGVNYMLMADVNNNYGGCGMQQDNVDVCIVTGDNNPLTNNTEYMCNSAPCAAGTCCLTGDWTVACGGVTDPVNNAQQAPNCDLNDFNVPGDPANGTWTLTVVDVCNMDTGTLDNFSLNFSNGVESCIVCSADGGLLDSLEITSCVGDDDLSFDLEPNYSGMGPPDTSYNYGYLISQNGIVLEVDTVADLTSQPFGTYLVHGLSYLIADSSDIAGVIGLDTATVISQLVSTTAPFCGDVSDNYVLVNILPTIPVTVIDTTVCAGECIMMGAQQVCASEIITLNSFYGCDSVINITINEATANAVIDPVAPPILTCVNPSVNLDGSSSIGDTFEWMGPNGFTSDQAIIDVIEPGEYTLTIYNTAVDPACQSSLMVTVDDGRVLPDLEINGVPPQICDGEMYDLSSLNIQDQNNTGATITFHSATPATGANELSSTVVNPANTTTYYILATDSGCTDEISVSLTVAGTPTADFNATAEICTDEEATIGYVGNALPNSTYNWDFDGGTAVPGTGAGPHSVSWPDAGSHTISLTVEENGCTSSIFTQDVLTEDPLPAPQVDCSPTTSSVTFSWDGVPGATSYLVNVINSPNGNAGMNGTDPNTYVFENLNPGNTVTIEVEAVGAGICGNSSTQYSCIASDCPDVSVVIDPVPTVCIDNSTTSFNLSASAMGGTGIGDFIWSGDGVTISGNFDPEQVPIGTTTITVDYYEGNCIYGGTTVDIDVHETPLVAINVPAFICSGEPIPITFVGIADPNSTFTWDFENGNVVSGSGEGPYEVVWPIGGEYDITLTVESPEGCVSETLVRPTILVTPLDDPAITCEVTTSTITFSWPVDPNASSYAVDIPNGFIIQDQSTSTEQVFHVINLNPGDIVPIEVEAIGAIPCGNAIFQTSCEVPNCPDVEITIDPVTAICRSTSTIPFNLNAVVTGSVPSGVLTWNGTGVDASGMFDPNQADIGTNTYVLTYEDGPCSYTESLEIDVFETPIADFLTDATACVNNAITVNYTGTNDPNLQYSWNFDGGNISNPMGPGPHDVSWSTGGDYTISLIVENENGCVSEETTFDVSIEDVIQMPSITCATSTTSITFSWNNVAGVVDSTISTSSLQSGTLINNTYVIDDLDPETSVDFELTLIGNGSCPPVVATATCMTDACPDITIEIENVNDLCLNQAAAIQLNPTITGSDGSGVGTWSGVGVNSTTGMFDPLLAGVGVHEVNYVFEEKDCLFEGVVEITVSQPPTASFVSDNAVCTDNVSFVIFDGTASAGATFIWDFDGGTAVPGTGPGPHQVSWSSSGNKTITLSINEGGCLSNVFDQQIQVDDEIATPDVLCSATTESIDFTWNDVAGATGYEIEIIGQGTGSFTTTDLFYTVSSLDPGEEVSIQVIPIGNTVCEIEPAIATCNADPCLDISIEIDEVDPICLMPNTENITLNAIVSGPPSNGVGTWSGAGVNAATGIFDPSTAGEGTHPVIYTYQIDNCFFTDDIQIKVGFPPVADAGKDVTLSCWESELTAKLGGDGTSTGPNILFEWSTSDGSLPDNTTILRPEVDASGIYILTVTDVELGCSDNDEVIVLSTQDFPIPSVSFIPSDCTSQNTTVIVDQINGGAEPYLFSLNGEPYIEEDTFAFLPSGIYNLSVIDIMGCENDTTFEVDASLGGLDIDLTANLVGRNAIYEGESIPLVALSNIEIGQLDSIVWSHPELLSCTQCLNPLATPTEETTFTVTIYKDECEASAELIIYVEYKSPIYVPTAFSPNADGVNDLFQIYAGPRVTNINTFMVFDRWGEMVYIEEDYTPNDIKIGWDGNLDGEEMRPAVFVWFVEVELADGSIELLEGAVNLIR